LFGDKRVSSEFSAGWWILFGFVLFETKQAQIPTKGLATSLGKMRGITALVEMN
jgi:hypothetical protein